jgi:hypothetical protein
MTRIVLYILSLVSLGLLANGQNNATSWQQYVVGPKSKTVYPTSILSTNGNVTNAKGLLPGGTKPAVLNRATAGSNIPNITVDFGMNVVGFLTIKFGTSSKNNPGIRLAFSETKQFLTGLSDFTRSDNGDTITPGTDQVAVTSSPHTWTDSNGCAQNGYQVCSDGLHGFRYVSIYLDALSSDSPYTQASGTVEINSISLNYTGYLNTVDTYAGWFECSDASLNKHWYEASYTNDMATDTFRPTDVEPRDADSPGLDGKLVLFDGAKRDRDPYAGDVAVSGITTYLTHFNHTSSSAKNVLADLANNQRYDGWIPPASINDYTLALFDYPLWWVVASWDYVLYTGDTAYATQYFSTLINVLDNYYPSNTDTETGLLTKPSGYGDYAFLPRNGIVTYFNTLYVLALQQGSIWANSTKNATASSTWLARSKKVSTAINAQLWDSSVGAYFDSLNDSPTTHAQDGNALAVLTGVANSTRAISSQNYLDSKTKLSYGNAFADSTFFASDAPERVYAFISSFDIRARFVSGQTSSALDQLRRLYGWMSTHDPGHTSWEGIGTGGSPYQGAYTSMAHGWSTGIVRALTNELLGISPTAPGGSSWVVKPLLGDDTTITWARGVLPTVAGGVSVSWNRTAGVTSGSRTVHFQVVLDAPGTTTGVVQVPALQTDTVTVDGVQVYPVASGKKSVYNPTFVNGYVVINSISGKHNITVLR